MLKPPKAAALTVAATLCLLMNDAVSARSPSLPQIEKLVHEQLERNPYYQPGDLVSKADVEPIINELLLLGLKPTSNEELYNGILPESNFLVRTLHTVDGRKFMQRVAKYPHVYDRLERLAWMPAGRRLIQDMLARPDGAEVLHSLTTPDGAKIIEKLMTGDPRVEHFGLPTGRVHTADELVLKLQETFQYQNHDADQRPN